MCGYSDLTVYESDAERNAVCAELARMLRIVPLTPSPAPAGPSRDAAPDPSPLARAGAGDPLSEVAPCS
jgi:hypothetical protein